MSVLENALEVLLETLNKIRTTLNNLIENEDREPDKVKKCECDACNDDECTKEDDTLDYEDTEKDGEIVIVTLGVK